MADRYMDGMTIGIALAGGDVSRAARAAREAADVAETLGAQIRDLRTQLAAQQQTAIPARARVAAVHAVLRVVGESHGDDVRRALDTTFRPAFKQRVRELSAATGQALVPNLDELAESRLFHTKVAAKVT